MKISASDLNLDAQVGADELAALFGCSTRLIRALAQDGIIVRDAHGRYDAMKSTVRYIAHLRDEVERRTGTSAVGSSTPTQENLERRLRRVVQEELADALAVLDFSSKRVKPDE